MLVTGCSSDSSSSNKNKTTEVISGVTLTTVLSGPSAAPALSDTTVVFDSGTFLDASLADSEVSLTFGSMDDTTGEGTVIVDAVSATETSQATGTAALGSLTITSDGCLPDTNALCVLFPADSVNSVDTFEVNLNVVVSGEEGQTATVTSAYFTVSNGTGSSADQTIGSSLASDLFGTITIDTVIIKNDIATATFIVNGVEVEVTLTDEQYTTLTGTTGSN